MSEKALEEALAERNRLWAELNEARVDRRELEDLRNELATIQGSALGRLAGRYQRLKSIFRTGIERLRRG